MNKRYKHAWINQLATVTTYNIMYIMTQLLAIQSNTLVYVAK